MEKLVVEEREIIEEERYQEMKKEIEIIDDWITLKELKTLESRTKKLT